MTNLLALDDFELTGQRVLLRVDLNVPVVRGQVIDTTRIDRIMPTLQELIRRQARVIIISHFGRPDGHRQTTLSLKPLVPLLAEKLGQAVVFADDCIGPKAEKVVNSLENGSVALLENLRFHPGEEANDEQFAKSLAQLADLYVNEAFSVSHRAHASVDQITRHLPAVAGRFLQQEHSTLSTMLDSPKRPVVAIVGGSKISTKIGVLKNLLDKVDYLILGGGIAHTFLHANGINIGRSICEPEYVNTVFDIQEQAREWAKQIILPEDAVVVGDLKRKTGKRTCAIDQVEDEELILDIGPASLLQYRKLLSNCHTVLWNGPVGFLEPPFDKGSIEIAQMIAAYTQEGTVFSVAGGGETVAVINLADCMQKFNYVSTAGGAFLQFLEGRPLPGVEALKQGVAAKK